MADTETELRRTMEAWGVALVGAGIIGGAMCLYSWMGPMPKGFIAVLGILLAIVTGAIGSWLIKQSSLTGDDDGK